MKAVMVDGTFAPLDMLFSKSEMLTILRSVPVSTLSIYPALSSGEHSLYISRAQFR